MKCRNANNSRFIFCSVKLQQKCSRDTRAGLKLNGSSFDGGMNPPQIPLGSSGQRTQQKAETSTEELWKVLLEV